MSIKIWILTCSPIRHAAWIIALSGGTILGGGICVSAQTNQDQGEQSTTTEAAKSPTNFATFKRGAGTDSDGVEEMSTIDRLNELQQQIRQLQDSAGDGIANPVRHNGSPKLENSQTGSNDVRPVNQLITDARVQAINQRIGIIRDLLDRQNAAAEAAEAAEAAALATRSAATVPAPALSAPPSEPESQPQTELELKHSSIPVAAHSGEHDVPPVVSQPADEGSHSSELPVTEPVAGTPLAEGVKVLSTPVNSFELANSLYVTKNYSQALKSYEALLVDETQAVDRDWLRCLAANCYRIQGDIPKAEKLYRGVAASRANSYPTDHSKWYLDHLARRKKITAEIQLIDADLQTFFPSEKPK